VGMKGEAVREIWHLEPERMTEMKMSGFRIRRAEVELPETSVLWEPHKPKAGETVRIEAVGGLEGERVELHYITDPWEARDRVVQMERQGELLVAEIELPAEANAVFFYASAGEEEQMQSLGPLSHRNLSPTDRKILRRYRHSFPVYGVDGKPVQDAEVCRAQMANFQGEPLEEVLSHLDRELAFHPEHFSIYATRWRFMLGEGAAAGAEEKVRAEQAALIARFPDRPEPLRVAGTWISGDLAYQEELSGDLYRRFPESREAKQAGLLILNQLFFAREHGKLAGAARDFIDRFPESAEIDLAYWYRLIGLGQVDAREAALLADSLMAGTTALHVDPERERSRSRSPMPIGGFLAGGLAYSLHFDLLSAEGDSTAALTLARRLIASGMQDPLPYLHIGERLAHVETWSLMSLREGLKEQAGTSYPRDLPLSIDLLEAGLQMTEPEKMFRLPNFNLYEDEDAPGAAERRRSCLASIARFRRQFLQPLGRCYFTQGEYRRAAAYLEEAAALQEQNSEYDHTRLDDAVYLLLGEVYEKMEDWRSAEAAYLRIIRLLHSHLQAEDALARVHGKLHGHLRGVRPLLETCYPEAPDFRVTGADGRPVRLSELRDKVVLVYYTLMPPAEFDEISAFLEDWAGQFAQKGLEVLFISGRKMVEIDPQERSFQIAVDDEGLREQYSIAYRSLFLIDRQGRLRLRQELHGRIRSEQETQVMRKIRELVAEKGSADGRLTSGEIER